MTRQQLKEGSQLRGFSDLPLSDIRLVAKLMAGDSSISSRRKDKPSKAECLNFIDEIKIVDLGPDPSRDEPHDSVCGSSSDDSDSD